MLLQAYTRRAGIKPSFWVRYVDDVLALVNSEFDLDVFLHFLNSLYPSLNFTHEWESNGSISFLDVTISKSEVGLKFKVFRKSTFSNSYLHFYSFHFVKIKLSMAQGLFLRALCICSPEFLDDEIKFIFSSLCNRAYPVSLLNKALSRAKRTHFIHPPKPPQSDSKIIVPFTPCLDSSSTRLLARSFNSPFVFQYPNKLKSSLVSNAPKPAHPPGVYKIPCKQCPKFYIGETGRNLPTRIKEHKYAVSIRSPLNALALHSCSTGHVVDFDSARLVYACNSIHQRRIMESALINIHSADLLNQNSGSVDVNRNIAQYLVKSFSH